MNGKQMQLTLAVAMVTGALAASTAFSQYSSPTAPSAQQPAAGTTTPPPAPPPPMGATTPSTPPATSMDKGTSSSMTPSKSEMSSSAFTKLDAGKRGYVTKGEVANLQGFDSAFQQADTNHDGKLSKDEFDRAWAIYSGQK
jgi:EF hand domain-containing protein